MSTIVKTAYTGALAINVRNLNEAIYTIHKKTLQPITVQELSNLLQFLESLVMSSNIYYDGTLPPSDLHNVTSLIDNLNLLDDFKSLKVNIKAINFKKKQKVLNLCKSSIEQAFYLIKEIPNEDEKSYINDDISSFESYFQKDGYTFDDRQNDANILIEKILSGEETFRGSKCIVGILLAKVENMDVYSYIKELFDFAQTDKEKRNLIAKLIDRFRVNYISEQATLKKAAYLANPAIENLRSQQTFLFWKYTMQKVSKELIHENSITNISQNSKQLFETFPVGLSILMNTPGKQPEALFETANLMKDNIFNAIMTSETPKERYIHSFSDAEFLDIQEKLFSERYSSYSSMSKLKRLAFRGSRSILLKGINSIFMNGFELLAEIGQETPLIDFLDNFECLETLSDFGSSYFGDVMNSLSEYQIELIAKINKDKYHDYISKNKRNLMMTLDDLETATAISYKVEKLFNRKLIY